MKFLAIVLGLSAVVCAQRVPITHLSNQNRNLKVGLPENCLQVNARQECVKCVNNFEVRVGKCAAVVVSEYEYALNPIHPGSPASDIVFYREDQIRLNPSPRQQDRQIYVGTPATTVATGIQYGSPAASQEFIRRQAKDEQKTPKQYGATLDLQEFIEKPGERVAIGTPITSGREFGRTLDLQDFIIRPARDEKTPPSTGIQYGSPAALQEFMRRQARDDQQYGRV